MIVGVPKEIKTEEHRVAITPVGTRELAERGHSVLIEKGAGEGSSIVDDEFEAQGATIVPSASEVFAGAEMILKVKEPQDSEIELFRPGQILFTYLHLAAYPRMAAALLERDVIAIAYETVQLPDRSLPLLAPMSEIAGRMATQVGAYFLGKSEGGRGVLLGGVTGVRSGKVVVIGGGIAGSNAAVIAVGMQADVVVLDTDINKLRALDSLYLGRGQDASFEPADPGGGGARRRRGDWHSPRPRRVCSQAGHRGHGPGDEAEGGSRRRRHRSGWVLRHLP